MKCGEKDGEKLNATQRKIVEAIRSNNKYQKLPCFFGKDDVQYLCCNGFNVAAFNCNGLYPIHNRNSILVRKMQEQDIRTIVLSTEKDANIYIGRDGDIKIGPENLYISRLHGMFCIKNSEIVYEDISKNGTVVDENRISCGMSAKIQNGTLMDFFGSKIKIEINKGTA